MLAVGLFGLLVHLAGCTDEAPEPAVTASPSASAAAPSPSDRPTPAGEAEAPQLAAAPEGDVSLWLDTIGVPVVAAVRTATPLAQLAGVDDEERVATCRRVAAELDSIATPQVLTALAITADAETATLLVGDLQAKADLLAACRDGGDDLEALIAEVEQTHAVAVAWLTHLREAS